MSVEFFSATTDSDFALDDRLRFLLGSWRRARPWDRADSFRHEFGHAETDSAGIETWRNLLAGAKPIPPRTYLPGLEALLFAYRHPESVEALEEKGLIRLRGGRVAFKFGSGATARLPHPEGWSLLLPSGATRGLEDLIALRFKQYARTRCGMLVSGGMSSDEWRDVAVLLGLVLDAADPQLVYETWAKSRVLNVDDQFIDGLPGQQRILLARELAARLAAASEWLGHATDLDLEAFAEGGEASVRKGRYPASPLGALLDAHETLDRSPHPHLDGSYFEDLSAALAATCNTGAIIDGLDHQPFGRCALEALRWLGEWAPGEVVRFFAHPAWAHFALFTILRLPDARTLGHRMRIPLDSGRAEVQRVAIARFCRKQDTLPGNILSLGLYLARKAVAPPRAWAGQPAVAPHAAELLDVFVEACFRRNSPTASAGVQAIQLWLACEEPQAAALLLALRASATLASAAQHHAMDLAQACAIAYQRATDPADIQYRLPTSVSALEGAVGALLPLREARPNQWQRVLRPFDPVDAFSTAKRSSESEDRNLSAAWKTIGAVAGHARVLLAIASAADGDARDDVLDAFDSILTAQRNSGLDQTVLSFCNVFVNRFDVQPAEPPTAVLLGRLARDSGRAMRSVRQVARSSPSAELLGQIIDGLGEGHAEAAVLKPHLADVAQEAIATDSMSLLEWSGLATVLTTAGLPNLALTVCRRIRSRLAYGPGQALERQADYAQALEAANLAGLGRWNDLAGMSEPASRDLRNHVRNFKALALLKVDREDEAEKELRQILREEPRNHMALVNLSAVLLQQGRWNDAAQAIRSARTLLDGEDPALDANEIAAHRKGRLDDSGAPSRPATVEDLNALRDDVVRQVKEQNVTNIKVGDGSNVAIALGDGAAATVQVQAEGVDIAQLREEVAVALQRLDQQQAGQDERLQAAFRLTRILFAELNDLAGMVDSSDDLLARVKESADDLEAGAFANNVKSPLLKEALDALPEFMSAMPAVLKILKLAGAGL